MKLQLALCLFSLTTVIQAVEVNLVKETRLSGKIKSIQTLQVDVPEDTAELIIDNRSKKGGKGYAYLNLYGGADFSSQVDWVCNTRFFRELNPKPGLRKINILGATTYSGLSLKIYLIPYKKVNQAQTFEIKPHELCKNEYVKVTLPRDAVSSSLLSGVYELEISTDPVSITVAPNGGSGSLNRSVQIRYVAGNDNQSIKQPAGLPTGVGIAPLRVLKPDCSKSYFFSLTQSELAYPYFPTPDSNCKVRINWYTATIQAVGGLISPGRELWMVAHGRTDNPDNAGSHVPFRTLASTLSTARLAAGVPATSMVLNWSEGAAANNTHLLTNQGLDGTRYINEVASTARRLLDKCGVTPGSLNLVGHSWGSLVSNDLAASYTFEGQLGKVARIVALDPAESGNLMSVKAGTIFLGDVYNDSVLGFSKWATRSLAIVAAGGLYGSEARARTAHIAIRLDVPSAEAADDIRRHALPVDTFYQSILSKSSSEIASRIWSLALNAETASFWQPGYVKIPRNTGSLLDQLPNNMDSIVAREKYTPLSNSLNFYNHNGVIGVHLGRKRNAKRPLMVVAS